MISISGFFLPSGQVKNPLTAYYICLSSNCCGALGGTLFLKTVKYGP